jgi:hypothetical protein
VEPGSDVAGGANDVDEGDSQSALLGCGLIVLRVRTKILLPLRSTARRAR